MRTLSFVNPKALIAFVCALICSAAAPAGDDYGFRTEPFAVNSGLRGNARAKTAEVYRTPVLQPFASLMRLHFSSATQLGPESYILITSASDGAWQRFTAESLAEWRSWSAIFNGNLVLVELHAGAGESASVAIDFISSMHSTGVEPLKPRDDGSLATLCGADNRAPSSDSRVGRLSSANCGNGGGCGGCTGWLASMGGVLTAGHCFGFDGGLIEFNVPQSSSNGVPAAADPADQYPLGNGYFWYENDGIGEDWAIFSVGANSNTGLRPHIVQGFFHLTPNVPNGGATVRVTGYGLDNTPAGPGGGNASCCDSDSDEVCEYDCNSRSLAQQTSTGPFDELVNPSIEYGVDTMPANSGSPVIREANGYAFGIHTAGGCENILVDDNQGTWLGYPPLQNKLNEVIGDQTFVDAEPVAGFVFGTVLYPARTIVSGAALVPNGGTMYIVEGSYTASAGNTGTFGTGNKAMTLTAPVGVVTIGQ